MITTRGADSQSAASRLIGTLAPVTFGCFLLFLCAACEPPGKPGPEPISQEDITDFTVLFTQNCSGCHGLNGRNGPARILNDPLYLAVMPRDELRKTIENGRPGTAMPAWAKKNGGPLTDKQVTALVDGIEKHWARPASFKNAKLPSYSAGDDRGNPANGKKVFGKDCFMCHGPGMRIGPVTDPTLLTLVSDQGLRTSVIVGRPDLGMPSYRNLAMGRAMSAQDITDVVAYLSSLRPVPPNVQAEHTVENGRGQGSGNGPGSPQQKNNESKTGSSVRGGNK
jgi:cytochrome c oxidase cbb3-type subunit 3